MGRDKDSNSQQSAGDSKWPSHVQITGNAPIDHAALPDAVGAAAAASSGEDQQQDAAPEEPPLHDDDPSWSFHEPASHVDPRCDCRLLTRAACVPLHVPNYSISWTRCWTEGSCTAAHHN